MQNTCNNADIPDQYTCGLCINKQLPFYKTSSNELSILFKDTYREVIKKFTNIHFNQINDNIQSCGYFELDELNKTPVALDNRDNFSIVHLNIVSLDKNVDEIKSLLYCMDSTPDIIAVSQTRIFNVNINQSDIDISGYNFIYDCFPLNGRAGGAGFYIKEGV